MASAAPRAAWVPADTSSSRSSARRADGRISLFFPAADADRAAWGCLPVWGYATVAESRCEGLAVGRRVWGYYPLGTHLVAFGEWCAARHSLDYATLPDWWMLFDVYDRQEQRFWSTTRRNAWAAEMGFKTVPRLYAGEVTLDQLRDWVHAHDSQFRQGHLEGIVVRRENADWLENRAKLVRADFTQTIEAHWKSRALEWNRVV